MRVTVEVDERSLEEEVARIEQETAASIERVLDRVGKRTVEILQGYVGETEDGRPAHPGGWGDRTGKLAAGYSYDVTRESDGWLFELRNTARHAHLIEALDGYFVVRGATEPGGPVWVALAQAVRELMPDWQVVR